MARPLRIEYPGAVYHVTTRGNMRGPIFSDEDDRFVFCAVLAETLARFHVLCHAYCLMGNHYHLLLETVEGNLCRTMRHLNGVYTQTFNHRHGKCGHLFQGRYKAILIEREAHLLEACRYIVLNPVRAGLVSAPEEWQWSSYRATAGLEACPDFLRTGWILEQFGLSRVDACRRYAEFVNDGSERNAWRDIVSGLVLGGQEFAARCRSLAHSGGDQAEVPLTQRRVDRPSLEKIMGGAQGRGMKWLEAVDIYGYTQKEVAAYCGVHYSYVSRTLKSERSKVKT